MALDPLEAWVKRLSQMKPTDSKEAGAKNLADFYGDLADKVEGQGGSPGIFRFNRELFVATLTPSLAPEESAAVWATNIANAWQTAVAASVITPGTVVNPAWVVSGVDVLTLPLGSASIPTLSTAKETLQAGLIASAGDQEAFAQAFLDATRAFTFLTIGLTVGEPPVPLPIPTPAN